MRQIITDEPFTDLSRGWQSRGLWPAKWIADSPQSVDEPRVVAYRRRFEVPRAAKLRLHVSADNRYELYLDGQRIGIGPERGDISNWFHETYELELEAGAHVLVARTWWLGHALAPHAQMTVRHGFLLAAEGAEEELLNTGMAEWQCKHLRGYSFIPPTIGWGTGAKLHIRGEQFDWGFERGEGDGWQPAVKIAAAANASVANEWPLIWRLRPATLPPMRQDLVRAGTVRHVAQPPPALSVPGATGDSRGRLSHMPSDLPPIRSQDHLPHEQQPWQDMLRHARPLTIPPHTRRRVIVDLENYSCAWPELRTSRGRGASVRIHWAESLYEPAEKWSPNTPKGNRDRIEGKLFIGIGDLFEPDGGDNRLFETLWWEAGRYLELLIATADEPLVIESLQLRQTHYPYAFDSRFEASDERLATVTPIALRTLEMCSHETYMDCPYYEQLMYVGDTRLEVLLTYATCRDDRLPRKALRIFDYSRLGSGLTQSRYPSKVTQVIPPFSLWWVAMVHDYAMWRDDLEFVRELMPGVRAVLEHCRTRLNRDQLLEAPNGWNFMDWCDHWQRGIPPEGNHGISAVLNWHFALVLTQAAELELIMGEPELSARNRSLAGRIAAAAGEAFWDESRGLLADDLSKMHYSEHAQCLAILSGLLPEARRDRIAASLFSDAGLESTTVYFSHYLFETYRALKRMDGLFNRLGLWFDMPKMGLRTTLEKPEPSRSDCHAWGGHPVFHYYGTLLGIRPASPAFEKVRIEPQLGPLASARGKMVHPRGVVEVDFTAEGGTLRGHVSLPAGVSGELVLPDRTVPIAGSLSLKP